MASAWTPPPRRPCHSAGVYWVHSTVDFDVYRGSVGKVGVSRSGEVLPQAVRANGESGR